MSETELESEIKQYKDQLAQIESVLNLGENPELLQVKIELEEIIKLTEETLIEVKKQRLLAELSSLEGALEDTAPSTSSQHVNKNTEEDGEDLVGSKCRVYYHCENTNINMHNALILGTDSSKESSVRVLFINPTHQSMKICEHFMNDTCRFNDSCKYSHGYQVNVEDLHSYLEPTYENLHEGSSCLVKHSDDLWHLASIESVDKESLCVRFKKVNLVKTVDWSEIYPLDNPHDEDDDYSDLSTLSSDSSDVSDDEEEKTQPTTKNKPMSSTHQKLGNWEKYTKGIGSKLMAKMGYVHGKGLGKEGEGRVLPVEVTVLPQGPISLDRVMEMKEEKALKKRKFKTKTTTSVVDKEETDVFDFLNETLLKKNTDKVVSKSSEASLNQTNAKGLNIRVAENMLETHNKIQDIEKHIAKLKQSLARNKNGDKATLDQIKKKLDENEAILSRLKKTESDISAEKSNRKKKSDIF